MAIPFLSQLDMGMQKIINLLDPTNPQDAATKAYVDSKVGGSGSIAIAAPTVIAGGSTLQISTEGQHDWMDIVSGAIGSSLETDVTNWHWKLLDGRMRKSFKLYGPTGTMTISTPVSNLAVTSTALDDGHASGVANADNLSGNTGAFQITANSALAYTGWGYAFQAAALKVSQTLNIYFLFSPGGGVATGQASIVARLSDGSFADQTKVLSAVVAGVQWYKCSITFKAGTDGAQLSVAVYTSTYGDSGSRIGFQAATLF